MCNALRMSLTFYPEPVEVVLDVIGAVREAWLTVLAVTPYNPMRLAWPLPPMENIVTSTNPQMLSLLESVNPAIWQAQWPAILPPMPFKNPIVKYYAVHYIIAQIGFLESLRANAKRFQNVLSEFKSSLLQTPGSYNWNEFMYNFKDCQADLDKNMKDQHWILSGVAAAIERDPRDAYRIFRRMLTYKAKYPAPADFDYRTPPDNPENLPLQMLLLFLNRMSCALLYKSGKNIDSITQSRK